MPDPGTIGPGVGVVPTICNKEKLLWKYESIVLSIKTVVISLGNEVLIESLLPVNGLAQFGQLGHWVGQVEQDPRKIRI